MSETVTLEKHFTEYDQALSWLLGKLDQIDGHIMSFDLKKQTGKYMKPSHLMKDESTSSNSWTALKDVSTEKETATTSSTIYLNSWFYPADRYHVIIKYINTEE